MRDMITLASSMLGRPIQVVPDLADDVAPAMVDPSQVEAAVLNICVNAREAMPDGGSILIRTTNVTRDSSSVGELAGSSLPPGHYIRISISDTGVGMTPEVKARAFEPFFTTKGPGGSGLGLSQVYGIVRQSGGDVTIDSTPGKGTQVTMYLPRATIAQLADSQPVPDAVSQAALADMANGLVLVVDDEIEVRQITVEMIRELGYEVAQAAGGEQALALINALSPPPRVILLDYAMPEMNGLQLAQALRERGIMAPIALVTGYADLSETEEAVRQLAGLLRKPFTIQDLRKLLVQLGSVPAEQVVESVLESGFP
jgi:CheY-like chemotaxis protein